MAAEGQTFCPIPVVCDITDGAKSVVAGWLDGVAKDFWNFALSILNYVLTVIDKYTAPDLNPLTGPLAGVYSITLWLGGLVALIVAFIQIGKAVMHAGQGFGQLFIGLGQFTAVYAGGLGMLDVMVTASNSLATGILQVGLHVDSWDGIDLGNSAFKNATDTVTGIGLFIIALIGILPAAVGLLLEALVRTGAILILAATIPILAGGVLADATKRWLWTGLRWMMALIMMTPTTALAIVIGVKVAQNAAGASGSTAGAAQAAVQAIIGGLILMIALFCPFALFKLFAFVDPNSMSGAAVRGYFAGGGGGSSGGASSAGSSEGSAESDSEGRFAQALGALSGGAANTAAGAAAFSNNMLDAVGAGHPTEPGGGGGGGGRGGGQQQGGDQGGDPDEPSNPDNGDGGDPPQPAPPTPPGVDQYGGPVENHGKTDDGDPPGGQPPAPPSPGGGGGGGGGAAAGGSEAAEAAVVVA